MRKSTKLMAGLGVVAGLGVALAPLGVHAGTIGLDHLQVTVSAACTLDASAENAYTAWDNLYQLTLAPNAVDTITAGSAGTSKVTILCNEAGGYQITGTGTNLTKGTATGGSHTTHPWTADTTDADAIQPGANPTAGSGTWGVNLSGTGNLTVNTNFTGTNYGALSGGVVASNASVSATAGDIFTVESYKVSTKTNQKNGTYQGDATYTLSHPIQ